MLRPIGSTLLGALLLGGAAGAADLQPITVFAAASLTNVLQDLGDSFIQESNVPVRFSFAASSALARQIESGAPADVFFSADIQWMDYLESHKLIQAGTRRNLVGNRLVLIAPSDHPVTLKIAPHFALAQALGDGRLAMGEPESVPAGLYAHEALTRLGVWAEVEPKLVRADSVRAALAYVDRGEAPLGIVYETDALVDAKVRIVDVFPAETHAPITYPIALLPDAKAPAAKFVAYLASPAGDIAFTHYGFSPMH